jgi:hypothetical protein
MATLERAYGVPQHSIDDVTPEIAAQAEHHVSLVWYVETLKMPNPSPEPPPIEAPNPHLRLTSRFRCGSPRSTPLL